MKQNLIIGIILTLISALCYSSQAALIKAATLPPLPMVIFIQSLVSLFLMVPLLFKNGAPGAMRILKTKQPKLQFIRAMLSLSLSFCFFYAMHSISLVNATLLANTVPLLMPFLLYFLMNQKINHALWMPLLIGFLGVILVLHPNGHIFNPASLLALTAALFMALSILAVRQLSATDSSDTNVFYFFLFSMLVSGIIAYDFWLPLTAKMWFFSILIGILYFFTQYFIIKALRLVNPQLISALLYSNIIYATVISELVWKEWPSPLTFFGMILIVIGGILCIRHEYQLLKRTSLSYKGALPYGLQTKTVS